MGFYDFPPQTLVIVSAPRSIVAEWRFVVVNGQIAAGCQYKREGELNLQQDCPRVAVEFAAKIASNGVEPDPVWVIDVCETADGQMRLLEIGGFSFAGLYVCDKRSIVNAVSRAAAAIWRESRP